MVDAEVSMKHNDNLRESTLEITFGVKIKTLISTSCMH